MATKPLTTAAAIVASARASAPPSQSPAAAPKPLPTMGAVELEPEMTVESVRVDGLAVMKIIKHTREATSLGNPYASGQLLGLDSKGVLTVSDVIPLPNGSLASAGEREDSRGVKISTKYTNAILPRLAALGSDANLVGFYMSTMHGQHLATPGFLDTLISSQLGPSGNKPPTKGKHLGSAATSTTLKSGTIGQGIALVYDLASSPQGTVNLKAYRLSQAFVDTHRAGRFDSRSLIDHKLTHSNIVEELPLSVQSSALLNAFLATLVAPDTSRHRQTSLALSISSNQGHSLRDFSPLGLASSSEADSPAPLSDTITALLASLEVHSAALSTLSFQNRQLARDRSKLEGLIAKRKADNEIRAAHGQPPLPPSSEEAALQEPSRLDTMCALSGVECAAQQLSEYSGTDLVRAYGAQAAVMTI